MTDLLLQHLKDALSQSNVIAYVWDIENDVFEWLGDIENFSGHPESSKPHSSRDYNLLINPGDAPLRMAGIQDFILKQSEADLAAVQGAEMSLSYKLRAGNGAHIDVTENVVFKRDEHSGKALLYGSLSKNAVAAQAIRPQNADGVAVLKNSGYSGMGHAGRRVVLQKLAQWFDTVHDMREGTLSGYLLTVGVDRMALFNEVVGAVQADEILFRTEQRLEEIIGKAGEVIRIDGDVFAILVPKGAHNEMASVGQYILNNFNNMPLAIERGAIGISVSVGGVLLTMEKDAGSSGRSGDPATCLTMAERALHLAKDKGGNNFEAYDEARNSLSEGRQLLKSAEMFMQAMKDNRLRLAFQPIVSGSDQTVSFHESLIRMIDPNGKILPAAAFVPAIERMGLSRLVDQYALQEAIQELMMFSDLRLSVNVSNLTLTNQDWLRSLVFALRDRPSVAKRLIVEITESAVVHDLNKTIRIINTLRDLGCSVALDDFGAGYTAFSQLKNLNVNLVKIDKSFVRNMAEDHNHLFIRTLRALAEGVNIKTVGEGAETLAEAQILIDDGIDYIQGYVYGFPRTERVWLPEKHLHRKISGSESARISGGDAMSSEELFGDNDVFRHQVL